MIYIRSNPLMTNDEDLADDNRRNAGRIRAIRSSTSIGSVLDVSSSGMRVLHRGKPPFKKGETICLVLRGPESWCRVTVKVCWIKRTGLRWHELGLEFVEAKDKARNVASSIARYALAGKNDNFGI